MLGCHSGICCQALIANTQYGFFLCFVVGRVESVRRVPRLFRGSFSLSLLSAAAAARIESCGSPWSRFHKFHLQNAIQHGSRGGLRYSEEEDGHIEFAASGARCWIVGELRRARAGVCSRTWVCFLNPALILTGNSCVHISSQKGACSALLCILNLALTCRLAAPFYFLLS